MIIITSLAVAGTAVFNEPIQNSITTKVFVASSTSNSTNSNIRYIKLSNTQQIPAYKTSPSKNNSSELKPSLIMIIEKMADMHI